MIIDKTNRHFRIFRLLLECVNYKREPYLSKLTLSTFKKLSQINCQDCQSIKTMFILIFQTYPNFSNVFDRLIF